MLRRCPPLGRLNPNPERAGRVQHRTAFAGQWVTIVRNRYDCCLRRSAKSSRSRRPMVNDIRIAIRNLTGVPGFAVAFVLTLGLGIGANTAIFSVINGVLLRPLPYPEADRIMFLRQPQVAAGIADSSFSFPEVADYRQRSKTIDQFVEFGDFTFSLLGHGEPQRAVGGLVTANFFPMLGAQPLVGRMLVAA